MVHEHGDHEHGDHEHGGNAIERLLHAVPFLHHHDKAKFDPTLESTDRGIWALKVSLAAMLTTACR